jgi:S-adenosylmethionine:tRNA ribosyltransferase-isomerase
MSAATRPASMEFRLPPELAATEPPEEQGLSRDAVRLMVAHRGSDTVDHRWFADLATILERGDVVVVNTSATLPAALQATVGERPAQIHLAGRLPDGSWALELRHLGVGERASTPWLDALAGTTIQLPAGGRAVLTGPAPTVLPGAGSGGPVRLGTAVGLRASGAVWGARAGRGAGTVRLWSARVDLGTSPLAYLAAHGRPIRYGYIDRDRPIGVYQTVFADEPGSAEMPSAARPFSAELVTRLAARGVAFAPFVLHCGVSSPEAHEPPALEWYRVPAESAAAINAARGQGHRVIAVGTTAVRALETVGDASGRVRAGSGWTDVVISPDRPVRTVDGLITGWHEPAASHLQLLEAVAGRRLLEASYTAALAGRYLWHEFGDSHLILR